MGRSSLPISCQAFTELIVGPESGVHQEEPEVGTSGHRDDGCCFAQDISVVLGSAPGSFSSLFPLSMCSPPSRAVCRTLLSMTVSFVPSSLSALPSSHLSALASCSCLQLWGETQVGKGDQVSSGSVLKTAHSDARVRKGEGSFRMSGLLLKTTSTNKQTNKNFSSVVELGKLRLLAASWLK